MPKIKVDKVTKLYGERTEEGLRLLDEGKSNKEMREAGHAIGCTDVTFDVHEGELLVVMGLSGSGKSTLIRCLNLLNDVTRGHIYVDDRDITAFSRNELLEYRRKNISMVFQHFALFPHRTVTDNAAYGLEVQGVDVAERRKLGREALQLVGLAGWEDAYPGQLSGGMQQRVGLARALTVKSEILLMDEAFSALDPLIRRDMQHELVQLQQHVKKTIVFITHDLDEALQLGDRIVLMKDGRVVQIGTPEDILRNPANAYVQRFVEHVDLSRVLTARAALVRARVVGFPNDGPRTAIHKMSEENYTSLVVTKRDLTYVGTVSLDAADEASKQGVDTIEALVKKTPAVSPDTVLTDVLAGLAEWPYFSPVADDETGELLGIITRASVISVLAESPVCHNASDEPSDAPTEATPAPEDVAVAVADRSANP